jgi:hypothetical protein
MAEPSDDTSASAADPASQEDLPAAETLISGTIAALRNREGTDVGLLDILAEHIVTMTPAGKAVSNAAAAIEALAASRAEEPDRGGAGHD